MRWKGIYRMAENNLKRRQRFAARLRAMLRLLVVWFVVSFGFEFYWLVAQQMNDGYSLGSGLRRGSIFFSRSSRFQCRGTPERDYADGRGVDKVQRFLLAWSVVLPGAVYRNCDRYAGVIDQRLLCR